jgi:uncharacterized protein involved in outer membrane biogenesis
MPRWAIVVLALLALIALLIGWQEWRGWPGLRGPLERRLTTQLHHAVKFDNDFAVHLLGRLQLYTGSLTVGQPEWNKSTAGAANPDMLNAEKVRLIVPYGGLIRALYGRRFDEVRVDEISLTRLEGNLVRDQSGRANWSLDPSGKAPVTPSDGSKPATMPHVQKLVLKEGRLSIKDDLLGLDLAVQASTSEGERGGGVGLEVLGKGRYKRNPFEVEVKSAGVLPMLTHTDKAPPVPIVIRAEAGDSRLRFDGQTSDLLRLGDLDGELDLKGPSLAAIGDAVGVTLPTTAVFALKGKLKKDGDVWGLQVKQLNVGASRLNGTFSFDRRPAVPFLQGQLSGSNLALADLAPAFGAPAPGAGNPKPPSGRVLPQREFDVPSLRAMDAQIALRIEQASLGSLFAQPLKPLQADLSLKSGVLTLTNVVARTAGGNLGGSVKLDGNGDKLLWDAKLDWSGIQLEYWLNSPKADADVQSKDKDPERLKPPPPPVDTKATAARGGTTKRSYVSGELAGNAVLRGEGNSTAQLLASLDGHATSWVRSGRLSRLIVEALSLHLPEAIGLWLTGDEQQPMQCAATRVLARNGQLIPEMAIVDTPSSTILASGKVSLASEELDLTLVSHPKTMSPLSLRTPIDVRGTFSDPDIGLHPNPLGLKVLGAVALGAVAPLAALIPLIDVDKQDDESGCRAALKLLQRQPPPTPRR